MTTTKAGIEGHEKSNYQARAVCDVILALGFTTTRGEWLPDLMTVLHEERKADGIHENQPLHIHTSKKKSYA